MTPPSKDSVTFHTITDDEAGQRLDNWLIKILKGVPKSHVYRIVRGGEVRINKGRCQVDQRVETGDVVRIPPIRIAERPAATRPVPAAAFPVVFEDDALLVIDKPCGVAVHGGSGVSFGVIEQLRAARPQAKFLELVHRLDRDTSGLLLIAKKRSALVALHDMIRRNMLDKRYLALGVGRWNPARKSVKKPLTKYTLPDGERRVRVDEAGGQASHTDFRIVRSFAGHTLIEATLQTGRTHQIRVHMQSADCPIAGDDKYGDYATNKELARQGLKRMFLHAWQLRLQHPLTGQLLEFRAPLPDELNRFIETLPE